MGTEGLSTKSQNVPFMDPSADPVIQLESTGVIHVLGVWCKFEMTREVFCLRWKMVTVASSGIFLDFSEN